MIKKEEPMRCLAVCRLAAAAFAIGLLTGAKAEAGYPDRTLTMVVPFAAGGPTDVLGRILAQYMSQSLGQQVAVEDVTGAGGTLGSARVARAAPDGYTMVMGNLGTHAASVGIYKKLSYDPMADFEPVILVGSTPMALLIKKNFAAGTLKDLIAYARMHKGGVSFGSAGVGSISHLSLLLFNKLADTGVQHVPYRGSSQADNDLIAGQIDAAFEQVITAAPHVVSGEVKAIAVTAATRAKALPDVPTTIEAGLPELQTVAWSALFFPKGTPAAIVEKVNAVVSKAMDDEAIIKRMDQLGSDLPPPGERTPQALGNLVRSEIAKWVPLIHAAGIVGD
jgi:tripartite-type tricarboxylate transporter receptor subunit TctC